MVAWKKRTGTNMSHSQISFTCVFCGTNLFAPLIKFYTLYNLQNLQKKKNYHIKWNSRIKRFEKCAWIHGLQITDVCDHFHFQMINEKSTTSLPIALYPPTGSGPTPQTKRGTLQYYNTISNYLRDSPQLSIFMNPNVSVRVCQQLE